MGNYIYVGALHNERPNLIKVPTKKETPKMFFLDQDEKCIHIIGNDTPRYLYNTQIHKHDFRWRYSAQEALDLLHELTAENVQAKRLALREAESEHGHVERFRLAGREQDSE